MPKKKAPAKSKSASKKKGGKKVAKAEPVEIAKIEAPPVAPVDNSPNANNSIYCETWEDVIWFDSPLMGQHNTQLHRISSIPDAFNARYDIIVTAVRNTLIPKRTQLIAQITRIDYRLEEIKTVKGIIYRDIKNEYGGVVERLNSAEGVKLAILQYDIAELQKDVNKIDGILQHLDELNGVAPQQPVLPPPSPIGGNLVMPVGQGINEVGFLLKYKVIQEDIDELITKQFKVDISIIPNDLPRELAEKRVKLDEYEKQKGLLKEKNDIILKLVQEMKIRESTIKDELDKKTKMHVAQSLSLLDDYASELKKFQLICTFWGVHLDHIAVNLDCPKNALISDVKEFVPPSHFYASIVPPKEFFATGRHFFVRPDEEDSVENESRLIVNDEALKDNEYAMSAVNKIRSGYSIEKEQALEAKLAQLSRENAVREGRPSESGVVNRKDFEFLLRSEFKLTGREIQNLLELITPSFEDKINFKSFFSFLRKGENFEDSFRRETQDEADDEEYDNTLKRESADVNLQGMLHQNFNKEDALRLFPTKCNEYDKEFLRERIDYQNAKNGLEGFVPYDDLVLVFVKSNINWNNEEIKTFLDSVPREGTRVTSYSGIEEIQFDVDYIKGLFDLL